MFTAEEYRTAAKVLRGSGYYDFVDPTCVAEDWDRAAENIIARERYAMELGWLEERAAPVVRGARILTKLLEDGWTPPEGLF